MARRLKDIIIHLDYEDEFKDGKVEVNIIASEPEELIRCKDCRYFENHCDCVKHSADILGYVLDVSPNDYCSFGERKEDGN